MTSEVFFMSNSTPRTSLGIDIGSTTAKLVVVRDGKIIYKKYERHFSYVRQKAYEMLTDAAGVIGDGPLTAAISGSAGLGIANAASIPFVQEVFATGETVRALEPDTAAVIELGGEDAKIIFFRGGTDERMNGSCAGGTGAFIDQMATLLDMTPDELDEAALRHTRIYPIASRCGVFAKSDIQPLLNQGASKDDIAASIYQAVVNQTITGLAQGRRIEGKVMFLGGPLYYNRGLRQRFTETLGLAVQSVHQKGAEKIRDDLSRANEKGGVTLEYMGYAVTLSNPASMVWFLAGRAVDVLFDRIKTLLAVRPPRLELDSRAYYPNGAPDGKSGGNL